ncbi:hypothetical protein WDU94_014995 [Cyamophila willieti]
MYCFFVVQLNWLHNFRRYHSITKSLITLLYLISIKSFYSGNAATSRYSHLKAATQLSSRG